MLTDIAHTLAPGLSCPSTFIAVQAVLSVTSVLTTFCCPSTLDSLPSTLTTIPAPCVSLHSAFANANPAPLPVPTTLQTIPISYAELKLRATTSSKATSTTSHSTSTSSHSTSTSSHSTSTTSSKSSSSTSATATSKAANSKHTKMHISTALKIILAIVIVFFIITLILIGFCVYRKISKKRAAKSSLPTSYNKQNGSGLGINGIGGGNAYGLGNGQENGIAGGPNGRERETGAGYEGFREEARKSFQLEQERIKAGLTGPFVKP